MNDPRSMNGKAAETLGSNQLMAILTARWDGSPQTTVVGYTNGGLTIYFVIFRGSQKFANIAANDRLSLAVFREPADIRLAEAFYAGAAGPKSPTRSSGNMLGGCSRSAIATLQPRCSRTGRRRS